MTPEERELRRALDSRSAEVTPEFRARLTSALAEGRPAASNFLPALAAVAAVLLMLATVGVLLLARQARNEPGPIGAATPTATPSTQPTPTPGSAPVAGVLVKPPLPIPLPSEVQVSAPSTTVVWAFMANQYLYRSTDGGLSWQQKPLPPSKNPCPTSLTVCFPGNPEISFVSDQEGWLRVSGATGPEWAILWHTTDAGATWQDLAPAGIGDITGSHGLSFIDSNRGFLDAGNSSKPKVIYFTTDGGRTWKASRPLPDPPGFKTVCVNCISIQPGIVRAFGSSLLVPADGQLPSGNGAQYVYRSTDGGATWSYLAGTRAYGAIALVTESRWIQLLPPGSGRETTDAGASWYAYTTNYTQAAPIAPQLVFADSQVGYATVRGQIARTLDGGLHWSWTAIKSPGT
jgi:photosystem II stability/assembly factor-like uncharacterized protein